MLRLRFKHSLRVEKKVISTEGTRNTIMAETTFKLFVSQRRKAISYRETMEGQINGFFP